VIRLKFSLAVEKLGTVSMRPLRRPTAIVCLEESCTQLHHSHSGYCPLHRKAVAPKALLGAAAIGAVAGAVVAGPMLAFAGAAVAAYTASRKDSITIAMKSKLATSIGCDASGCAVQHRYADGYCHLHRKMALEAVAFDASRLAMVLQAVFRSLKARQFVRRLKRLADFSHHLSSLPRDDPKPNTPEFYALRTPLEFDQSKAGWQGSAIKQIEALRAENEAVLNDFFDKLHNEWHAGVDLSIVNSSAEVVKEGLVCVKHNRKSAESILAKAARPGIKEANPQFDVSHVRDAFRFKVSELLPV
jgi:hypothetical protein